MTVSRQHSLTLATHCTPTAAMLGEALPPVDMIKEEVDVETDPREADPGARDRIF